MKYLETFANIITIFIGLIILLGMISNLAFGTFNLIAVHKAVRAENAIERDLGMYAHLSRDELFSEPFQTYTFKYGTLRVLMEAKTDNSVEFPESYYFNPLRTMVVVSDGGKVLGYVSAEHVNFDGTVLKARLFKENAIDLLEVNIDGQDNKDWMQVVYKYGDTVESLNLDLMVVKDFDPVTLAVLKQLLGR